MTPDRIRARLIEVRDEIWVRETSDDRAHTGFYRERLLALLSEEASLSGLLRRLTYWRRGDNEPEQLEFVLA